MSENIVKAGEQRARIVHVARVGKHTPKLDKFAKGSTPRLWITYEFLDDKNDEGNNRWISFMPYGETMNSYFTEKGKQADWLDDIGLKENTEESLRAAVGRPVWVEIEHYTNTKTGKTYANIVDVSKVRPRDAEDFPELGNEGIYFDFYRPVKEDYLKLPKWVKDYIKTADDLGSSGMDKILAEWDKAGAEEYKASKPAAEAPAKAAPKGKPQPQQSYQDDDDDVPF